jgi:hypothetical protein
MGGVLSVGKGEAVYSPPPVAEAKNVLSPMCAFMVVCLIKHRDNFTFV